MSSTERAAWLAGLLLAATLPAMASGTAERAAPVATGAAGADICSVRQNDPLQQIHLFDGPPVDLAYLAPDGSTGRAAATYSLKAIHGGGGSVTVRCTYRSGAKVDVVLARKISQCQYRPEAGTGGQLRCR